MPVWHETLKEARKSGLVEFLGVVQEQHPERCQLFAQFKQFDWPILLDPINSLGLRAVPVIVAIDEHGVVREKRPRLEEIESSFLKQRFGAAEVATHQGVRQKPDLQALRATATSTDSPTAWKDLGDALLLWKGLAGADEAIQAYRKALAKNPQAAEIHFRLGVAHRMRYERQALQPAGGESETVAASEDFQAAVDSWGAALELDPNHYIYRRRIQQYGPRLIKPYPFYDWVTEAKAEITGRGETPISLPVEPSGAEIAKPSKSFDAVSRTERSPDADGKIQPDVHGLIRASAVVVPSSVKPGEAVRVHAEFRPTHHAHWNNEAEPLTLWLDVPQGWESDSPLLRSAMPKTPESRERRLLEFELKVPSDVKESTTINAYALYYVCKESGGTCLYLRQALRIPVRVSDRAP